MTNETTLKSKKDNNNLLGRYTLGEEIFNSITHGIGVLFSIVALVLIVAVASARGDIWLIVSGSIYGFTLFLLYISSTLYHSIYHEKAKKVFRIFDHAAIYLVIAGSYTPIALVALKGTLGWIIFSLIWSFAIAGIILKAINFSKTKYISTALYLAMGWLIILAIRPLLENAPFGLFIYLLIGGLFYTIGTIFYACKRIPYNHGIWHLFVLAGSVVHYLGILFYLAL